MNDLNLIRVLLVDDHAMFAEGLKSMLERETDIEIIGMANSGIAALEILDSCDCDLVITDLSMDMMDGLELTKQLNQSKKTIKILVVSMHKNGKQIERLMAAGANGYLLKNSSKQEFLEAIRLINRQGDYFSQDIKDALFKSLLKTNQSNNKDDVYLTNRENEILKLILEEYSNPAISEKLFISLHTVETHRRNLMKKLDVKNSVGLYKKALELGIIEY